MGRRLSFSDIEATEQGEEEGEEKEEEEEKRKKKKRKKKKTKKKDINKINFLKWIGLRVFFIIVPSITTPKTSKNIDIDTYEWLAG
jgi:uncharacterized protein YqhQ